MSGLVFRLTKGQRIYIGAMYIEAEPTGKSVSIFIAGPKPFPLEVKRESSRELKQRLGGHHGNVK